MRIHLPIDEPFCGFKDKIWQEQPQKPVSGVSVPCCAYLTVWAMLKKTDCKEFTDSFQWDREYGSGCTVCAKWHGLASADASFL